MLPKIELPTYTLELPSTKEKVVYRPFTVKERKLFMMALEGGTEDDVINSVKQVARNCVLSGNVDKFTVFDMDYFFLQLRAKAIGGIATIHYNCEVPVGNTTCNTDITVNYNLEETKVIYTPGHDKKIDLSNGVGVVMKYPSIENRALYTGENISEEDREKKIASCIDYVYDQDKTYHASDSSPEELIRFVEEIPDTSYTKITNFFNTMPYVKDTIEATCPKCKTVHVIPLEGLINFFD